MVGRGQGWCLAWLSLAATLAAQAPPQARRSPRLAPNQMVARIVAGERAWLRAVRPFRPRVETYIQSLRTQPELGPVPVADDDFLGYLDLRHGLAEPLFTGRNTGKLAHAFFPLGFAAMIAPDWSRFDSRHYRFTFIGREFLGAVGCIVFDVQALRPGRRPAFIGRIWAEDHGYTLVRFDGTYVPNPKHRYVHFDSWRMNLGPDLWLPAAIYSQEEDQRTGWFGHISFRAETRFWGYALSALERLSEATSISVEGAGDMAPQPLTPDLGPLGSERAWELKAEDDVLGRMQAAGLLSLPGAVDRVLATVVNNLELSNHLSFTPPVRCRVLLTAPLESFTVGHTIVLSRGLIDVLPNEASLAMALAHELGRIALDQGINTDYAFDDRMLFPDTESFTRIRLAHTPAEEAAADAKGLELLEHSPYRGQLSQAGLFLEALQRAAPGLPNLLRTHWGDPLVLRGRVDRMRALLLQAPRLETRNLRQIPALPLGARLALDPWSDRLRLLAPPAEALISPRDKLLFAITPYFPYLRREAAADPATPR